MENLINATVRRKDDVRVLYGTVVDETDTKARVRWGNGTLSWEQKRDLYVLD